LQQELAELRSELDARLAREQSSASLNDDAMSTGDDVETVDVDEAVDEIEASEPAEPVHERAATPAPGMSEAMLALQRLREAVQNGEEEHDDDTAAEPVVELSDETPPTSRMAGDDSDVSIEDYMSKLMQRVRGKSEDELPTPKRKPAAAPPKPSPAAVSKPTPAQREALGEHVVTEAPSKPLETLRSLPTRAVAPEQSGSLQAMRELANQSARTAIDTSAQRRWSLNMRGKIVLSIASTASSGLLLSMSTGLASWTTLGAVGSLALAGAFGWQAWKMKRHGRPSGG
jgi:hypothetical protein